MFAISWLESIDSLSLKIVRIDPPSGKNISEPFFDQLISSVNALERNHLLPSATINETHPACSRVCFSVTVNVQWVTIERTILARPSSKTEAPREARFITRRYIRDKMAEVLRNPRRVHGFKFRRTEPSCLRARSIDLSRQDYAIYLLCDVKIEIRYKTLHFARHTYNLVYTWSDMLDNQTSVRSRTSGYIMCRNALTAGIRSTKNRTPLS